LQYTRITLGFPTAHIFTFLSSPPVTITRPDDGPIERHVTFELWATNSSTKAIHISINELDYNTSTNFSSPKLKIKKQNNRRCSICVI